MNRRANRHSEKVTTGDITIETYVDGTGDSDRSDVVMLPSYGRDGGEDFDPVAATVAGAGYRVLRPQPRGVAGSTGPMTDVTIDDLAEDIARVIDRLCPGKWSCSATRSATSSPVRWPPNTPTRSPPSSWPPRLAALRLAFFAPDHDPSAWLTGWYSRTLARQHAAVTGIDLDRYWGAARHRSWNSSPNSTRATIATNGATWARCSPTGSPLSQTEEFDVTITLITGANKGLGRETARRLLMTGHTVLVGARDPERGRRAADELGAVFLDIDPTSDTSVTAAAERVRREYGRLDVLVNNAGTAEPRVGAADLTAAEAMRGFEVNVFGPIRVTHAFLPLLRASDHPRIVNVSSGVGSFTRILTPGTAENLVALPVYPATKAALTMLTVQYARALDGILVNAADPGFTGTDFNNNRGTQTVTEGTEAIVHLATLPKDGPTGTFQDRFGIVPW